MTKDPLILLWAHTFFAQLANAGGCRIFGWWFLSPKLQQQVHNKINCREAVECLPGGGNLHRRRLRRRDANGICLEWNSLPSLLSYFAVLCFNERRSYLLSFFFFYFSSSVIFALRPFFFFWIIREWQQQLRHADWLKAGWRAVIPRGRWRWGDCFHRPRRDYFDRLIDRDTWWLTLLHSHARSKVNWLSGVTNSRAFSVRCFTYSGWLKNFESFEAILSLYWWVLAWYLMESQNFSCFFRKILNSGYS